jgi:hypothetical protein
MYEIPSLLSYFLMIKMFGPFAALVFFFREPLSLLMFVLARERLYLCTRDKYSPH